MNLASAAAGFILLLYGTLCHSQETRVRDGQLDVSADLSYYSSSQNFDANEGAFEALDAGHSYSEWLLNSQLDYGWTDRLSTAAGLNIVHATADDPNFTRSNSQVRDIYGVLKYRAFSKPFQVYLKTKALIPLFTVDSNSDEVILGDGAIEAEPSVLVQWPVRSFVPYAEVGYRYRDQGLATLLTYQAGLLYRSRPLWIKAFATGFDTLSADQYTNSPGQRNLVLDRVNAGSLRHYSVDPSVLDAGVQFGIDLNKQFLLLVGYQTALNGSNYSKGDTFTIGIDIQRAMYSRPSKKSKVRRHRRTSRETFEPDESQIDETLFEPDPIQEPSPESNKLNRRLKQIEKELEDSQF